MPTHELQSFSTIPLGAADVSAIVDVLCDAFFDYPVMRFVIGPGDDYADRLRALISMFVAARALRNDPMFGVRAGAELVATMTTSNPADPPHPDFPAVQAETWRRLGADAERRYAACASAWESIAVDRPQLHVNMIGVCTAYQGKGLARTLLEQANRLCEQSAFAEGVSLTTEVPRNVEFYRHVGYEITGEANISNVLTTWNLFRFRS